MVQIIKCSHGEIFAACCVPECYEDVDWQREMRKYIKNGCTVEMIEKFEFGECDCSPSKKNKNTLSQIPMF